MAARAHHPAWTVGLALALLATGTPGGTATDLQGPSLCSGRSDLILCDDFEKPEIDGETWTLSAAEGNRIGLDRRYAAGGRQSVHLQARHRMAYLSVDRIFPVPHNRYWGRLFLRVARFSTVPWAHWTVAEAAGEGDGSLIRVGGQYVTSAGVNRWGVGSDGGPTGDWTSHDRDPAGRPREPPTGTWVCVEWLHDGAADRTHFFVDGVEHPSLTTTADEHGGSDVPYRLPELRSLWVGWWQYQEDPEPFDVWIDEVAVDDERVGCR